MKKYSIALLVFGESGSNRNALTEEKYKGLASAFAAKGFQVDSVLYNDLIADRLAKTMLIYDAILVWVNPIEQGNDRKKLDALLIELSNKGCIVSAHPEVILKIGTKDILYKTRKTEFGGKTKLYPTFDEFKIQFFDTDKPSPIRILKQYRGNGGIGVFKIDTTDFKINRIGITAADGDAEERIISESDFFEEMKFYFANNGMLIEQEWNPNIINGMVRCYLTGTKVVGFGYQEINALYPDTENRGKSKTPNKRFYFTEDCGLFQDLKKIMETSWVAQLQEITAIENEKMPIIWDADFFINKINTENTREKYTLCEINVSCVSPFPESSIPYIIEAVSNKINTHEN
ncbi:MAG: Cj0069 family protein [Saprospiraceae bacterium]